MQYVHKREYYSVMKRNEVRATRCKYLGNMLTERSQTHKATYCRIPFIWTVRSIETESRSLVAKCSGESRIAATANGYEISLWGNENILEPRVVMVILLLHTVTQKGEFCVRWMIPQFKKRKREREILNHQRKVIDYQLWQYSGCSVLLNAISHEGGSGLFLFYSCLTTKMKDVFSSYTFFPRTYACTDFCSMLQNILQ